MTTDEACDVAELVLAAYPTQRQRMSREDVAAMTTAYANGLLDLDATIARAAVSALVLTEQWMPTIATIRGKALEMTQGRKREGGEAWGDVVAAMKRYGWTRTPGADFTFADPLVARCVKALGWGELCRSENAIADRARFIELYAQYAKADVSDRSIAQALPGVTVKELPSGTRPIADVVRMALPGGDS